MPQLLIFAATQRQPFCRAIGAEETLAREASHDPLTGLANRALFFRHLDSYLKPRSGRRQEPDAGVLFLDLNGFKPVNDTFGHDAGDEVLLTVAHRLRRVLREQDTIARLGGDEFAVAVPRTSAEQVAGLVQRLDAALAEPYRIHVQQVPVRASIGGHVATAGESPADALRVPTRTCTRSSEDASNSRVSRFDTKVGG